MPVHCKISYKGTLSKEFKYVCFGFIEDLTSNKIFVRDSFTQEFPTWDVTKIDRLQYFPFTDLNRKLTAKDERFLLAVEKLNINKVVPYIKPNAKTARERFKGGLTADTNKFSAPMITGAFEVYRIVSTAPSYVDLVDYLLKNRVSPKIAVFLPEFFGICNTRNSVVNNYSGNAVGYGSFNFWTKKHLDSDSYPVATKRMDYHGIHNCYAVPMKSFITPLKEVPGSLEYKSAQIQKFYKTSSFINGTDRERVLFHRKASNLAKEFPKESLLKICRKMQNGRL